MVPTEKMLDEGQPCRKCGELTVMQWHPPEYQPRPGQKYYFEYWLRCPGCKTLYMIEQARRYCP
jgi:hypothetical protein